MLSFNRHLSFLVALLFLLPAIACTGDDRQVELSQIQPRPVVIPGTNRIEITSPAYGANLTRGAAAVTFTFDTSGPQYATLLIFSAQPAVLSNGFGDVSATCLGGATELAKSHAWNDRTIRLDHATAATSEVYVCDGANRSEPLSLTNKVLFTAAYFNVATYYWALIGYDKTYKITHSSPLYTINAN